MTSISREDNKKKELYLYGPVPSRRLGFSLGIDILPFKTCSFDCIYCQLGPTPKKTIRKKKYFSADTIMSAIQDSLSTGKKIDYITFSGSGEPTLNLLIGHLIQRIKRITNIPVAVLTNSSLMMLQTVRNALKRADLVVPSLDAATQKIFEKTNQPHPSIQIRDIINGLIQFRREFKGKMWLEVMLVEGVNDSPAHIKKLKEAIHAIEPDKVQLNTVVRPPAQKTARPLSKRRLEEIRSQIGDLCEIVADFPKGEQVKTIENLADSIISVVKRRPVTISDLSDILGRHKNEVIKSVNFLLREKKIRQVRHENKIYYEPD